jgi:hypothetical protein
VLYSLSLGCFATVIKTSQQWIKSSSYCTGQHWPSTSWKNFWNNKSLFASIESDSNLTQEGNIVLGGKGGEDSEDDNIVFKYVLPPSEDDSDANESIAKDAPTQMKETPCNLLMSFVHQVIWHWN